MERNNGKPRDYSTPLMLLACLFFAGSFFWGKVGIDNAGPGSLTFIRFFLCLIPMTFFYIRKGYPMPTPKEHVSYVLLGLTGVFAYHYLFFLSLRYTSAASSAIITAMNPLISSVLASIWVRESLSAKRCVALLIAFSGIILSASGGNLDVLLGMDLNKGEMIMFSGVCSMAVYVVTSKHALVRHSPYEVLFWSYAWGTLIALPFFIAENPIQSFAWQSKPLWFGMLYMTVFSTFAAHFIKQIVIQKRGVAWMSSFINTVPLFTVLLSVIVFRQRVETVNICAMILIATGVWLNTTVKVNSTEENIQ